VAVADLEEAVDSAEVVAEVLADLAVVVVVVVAPEEAGKKTNNYKKDRLENQKTAFLFQY
jgi:hypothetical protein